MNKIVIGLMVATLAFAGAYEKTKYTDCKVEKQAEFVLSCIKNANPKSDEEPEDWINECKSMSVSMFCKEIKYGYYWESRIFSPNISCNCGDCTDIKAIESCKEKSFL